MNVRSKLPLALIGAFVLASQPSEAAILLLGGPQGTQEAPQPTEGAQTEENWNPTVTCEIEDGQTIFDLLQCLLDSIANGPPPCVETPETPGGDSLGGDEPNQNLAEGGPQGDDCSNPQAREDFIVRLLPEMPPYGLEILTLDLREIERIALWENDPGIQTTELRLDRSDRFVRIGEIVETPSGVGSIFVTLNATVLRIPTAGHETAGQLTATLIAAILAQGYMVDYESPHIFVHEGLHGLKPLTRVQFRSTDPAIVSSSIGIFPLERPE